MKTKLFLRSGGADENQTFFRIAFLARSEGADENQTFFKSPATLDLQRKGAEERLKTKLFNF